jgi:hypothetical protein
MVVSNLETPEAEIRLIGAADVLLFCISLLIFFVAYLLSLRSR